MPMSRYARQLRALLSPEERRVLAKLSTAKKVQDYLETLQFNFEESGETQMSPRRVLRTKKAHCIEGALLAATALAYHGRVPMLMDLQSLPHDHDHVVALYKENNLWGAISKTNHSVLRWRDPVYQSPRELAMSYFHEYFLKDGTKSMRAYSAPFDLRRYTLKRWVVTEDNLEWLAVALDDSRHFPVVPKKLRRHVRPASLLERQIGEIVEQKPKKRNASR